MRKYFGNICRYFDGVQIMQKKRWKKSKMVGMGRVFGHRAGKSDENAQKESLWTRN